MAHSLLPEKVADCLNDVERMQRTSEEVLKLEAVHGKIKPYTDGVFAASPRVYYRFCRRLRNSVRVLCAVLAYLCGEEDREVEAGSRLP